MRPRSGGIITFERVWLRVAQTRAPSLCSGRAVIVRNNCKYAFCQRLETREHYPAIRSG
jgi:hypothetical protein